MSFGKPFGKPFDTSFGQPLGQPFLEASLNSHSLVDNGIPKLFVGIKLTISVGRFFQNLQGMIRVGVLQELGRDFLCLLVYLCKETQSQDSHALQC